jgi:hypothetical protein
MSLPFALLSDLHNVIYRMSDGATVSYDLYQPPEQHEAGDCTLALCPGIGNSSESVYIRSLPCAFPWLLVVLSSMAQIGPLRVRSVREA